MSHQVCVYPRLTSMGGVGSFRVNFLDGLNARGIQVCHDLSDPKNDAILVLGGTRNLVDLWRTKRRGVPIVQRLDGINWVHRKRRTSWRHYLRAEYGNRNLLFIRSRLADRIIYQSQFVRGWWEDWYGPTSRPSFVVYNGVDLSLFTPEGPQQRPLDRRRLLVVEGSLGGGYDMGLENAVRLAERLAQKHGLGVELMVVGKVSPSFRSRWEAKRRVPLIWAGLVSRQRIPEIDRSAHLLFSADLHPACPNAVLEALACGLPVVAFDTGSLKELVPKTAGRIVPYGGDPWEIDPPDITGLARVAAKVLTELPRYRQGARAHAEAALGLDKMIEGYLKVLLG
jgi:glycosyltransferase involved in cell wall biosynthesis